MLEIFFIIIFISLQVPYIPASKAQVDNVMTLLKGRNGGLVDLGSGDGRIVSINRIFEEKRLFLQLFKFFTAVILTQKVLEASRRGFSPAVGYELNPWLIRLSRFYAWRADRHKEVSYRREDLWKV